jgi:hypothetical protein
MKESTKDNVLTDEALGENGDYYKISRGDLNTAPMGL